MTGQNLGGKGGPKPKPARRVVRQADEEQVLKVVGDVVEYHNSTSAKKQRIGKLLDDQNVPYRNEV